MKKQSQYIENLSKKFHQLNYENNIEQRQKKQCDYNINENNIIGKAFPLQKKGKNFGIEQLRTFCISTNKLLQIGNKNQIKQLPLPQQILIQYIQQATNKWNQQYLNCKYRIILDFQKRTPITIYFKNNNEANQMLACISSIKNKSIKIGFNNAQKIYSQNIRNTFLRKILSKRKLNKTIKKPLSQIQLIKKIQSILTNRDSIKDLIMSWHSAMYNKSKNYNLSIKIESIISFKSPLGNGIIKIWHKGQVQQRIKIDSNTKKYKNLQQYQCIEPVKLEINNADCKSIINIQIQHQEMGKFKAERFNLFDLRKRGINQNIGIYLYQGQKICIMKLSYCFKLQQSMSESKINITPQYYPIINQIYSIYQKCPDLPRQLNQIHTHHKNLLKKINQSHKLTSFHSFRKYMDLLKIQQLINKFYMNHPFNQYIMVQNRGSFIYDYILKQSQRFLYYDVQKIYWKDNNIQRRFLSVLKCFDENPRIIFTQPFCCLAQQLLRISQNLSFQKWPMGLFQQNLFGFQAMGFFFTIAVLKVISQILIYNPPMRRSLQYDSLLFHYTLKTGMPKIYQPLLSTQINFQALFGQHYVSLFSRILPLGLFEHILDLFLNEVLKRQQKPELLNLTSYNYTLIGTFLTIIQIVCYYQTPFISGQHFIIFLQQYFKNIPLTDYLYFLTILPIKIQLVKQCSNYSDYIQLKRSMQNFYHQQLQSQMYQQQLSQISKQLYNQFISQKHKNNSDLRKIFIIIDKIQLNNKNNNQKIILSIYQNKDKLYQHQFQRVNLSQLQHPIQLKIIRLDQIKIVINQQGQHITYQCSFNIKFLPSNYYLQKISNLIPSKRQKYRKMYISYQIYIKDSSQIQFLQNNIPQKYINIFCISSNQLLKQDILYINNYARNFRSKDNNFNILYSKLCWYGGHYILPDQRLIDMRIIKRRNIVYGVHDNRYNSYQPKNIYEIIKYSRYIYGKAIIPFYNKQSNKFYTTFIKNDIIVQFIPKINQISYDSANGLSTYLLNNFTINYQISFLQFYVKMLELPLIQYLTYKPLQFYLLPSITFQLIYQNFKCFILISRKGKQFRIDFTKKQIQQIEQMAKKYIKLPENIQFQYCDNGNLTIDTYFHFLRINLLLHSIQQNNKPTLWPNLIILKNIKLSNISLRQFYISLNQIQQNIILQFKDQLPTSKYNLKIIHHKKYVHFAHIGGKWKSIAIIIKLISPSLILYYAEQKNNRNRYLFSQDDIILNKEDQNEKQFQILQFTEKQLIEMKQCVLNEINKFL